MLLRHFNGPQEIKGITQRCLERHGNVAPNSGSNIGPCAEMRCLKLTTSAVLKSKNVRVGTAYQANISHFVYTHMLMVWWNAGGMLVEY